MDKVIDLVVDLGEGFGKYSIAEDDKLLELIGSCNIACGFHAGDPQIMANTVQKAVQHGVGIGAHPSFPDLVGFGRRRLDTTLWEVTTDVLYQLGSLDAFAKAYGGKIQHVAPHGALGNLVSNNKKYANAFLDAVELFDPNIIILAQRDEFLSAAENRGFRTAITMLADRGYNEDGTIISRSHPNAVINSVEEIVKRTVNMVLNQQVTTVSGKIIQLEGQVIQLHSDNDNSLEIVKEVKIALLNEGIKIKPMGLM